MTTMRTRKQDLGYISKYSTWLILWGVVLAILGALAISASVLTTLITIFVLGIIVTAAGVVMLIDSFGFWWGKWNGFVLHFLLSLLYIIAGLMLIEHPLLSSISITLILGIAYTVIGLIRCFNAAVYGSLRWGWTLFNGLITFILGILILESWPASSLFVIGLFVGIDLLFVGFAYIAIALAAKKQARD